MKKIFALVLLCISVVYTNAQNEEIVKSNNEFAFDLMKNVVKTDTSKSNMFVSPFSVYNALSMTYDGAAKKTALEMRSVLKFNKNQKESHKAFTNLLNNYKENKDVFVIANAAVTQENYNFLESYTNALSEYNAKISKANFMNADSKAAAIKDINKWVSLNTNNKIEDLLHKEDVDDLTRLILLNAIYFRADWAKQFKVEKTRNMTFYGNDGTEYVTEFMNGAQKIKRSANKEALMVKMDYANNAASMFILLPAENTDIETFINNLTADKLNSYEETAEEGKVDISIPKFKIEARYKMKEPLMNMGIKSAFSKSANFSKMNGKSDLLIDDVIHQSFIEFAEYGTEAAAATAVVVREKTAMMPNEKISINRPFVFVIRENKNNAILFVGKYVKPEKSTK